jgi:glycosyltransferase involved in cell wall biosynthesis
MRLIIYGDIGGSGGYVRYCKGLLGSKAIPDDVKVWFISSLPFYEKLAPLDAEIKVITHPWMISKSRLHRYLWYLWVYPRLVGKIKPDVEFYPSGQLRVHLRKAFTITTCHNLLLFDKKELARIKNKDEQCYFQLYRKNQVHSFQKSKAVIFLSKYSQNVVNNEVPVIKHSAVIAHGLDPVFLKAKKRSYNLGNKIKLLYISPFYHYKHQVEVVKAVQLLRDCTGLDIGISLIGGGDSSAALELNNYVINENIQPFVFVKGNMNYENLSGEYSAADIFIFASSCETFGITILEAMGARLPIACSDRTGLSEILKDASLYFNPEDPKSIADTVQKLILDINLRETLGEKAYNYALDYTWKRCASETFNYIKQLKNNEK